MNTATTPTNNEYELIQRFFDFDLDKDEIAAFEQRMQTDTDFLDRIRLYQQMEKHIDGMSQQENAISTTAKTVKLEPRKTRLFQLNTIRAAAAMLVLAIGCLFVFWMFSNGNKDSTALAQNYWEQTDKLVFSYNKSSEETTDSKDILVEASNLFEAKDIQRVLTKLEEIPTTDPLFPKAALLKGEAFFEQKKYDLAIQQFEIVRTASESEHKDLAYWFQALTYLQNGEIEQAKSNLDFIIQQQYPLQKKATELLSKL